MKKIIISAVFIMFSTISAKAADLSALSLTAGLATNSSVWGADGKETKNNEDNTTSRVTTRSGVFTESFSSQFIELGIGQWISLGYEHTPDSISTPQNVTNEGKTVATTGNTKATVSVDFNDVNTTYIKINTPMGIYFKWGNVETDLDIKETVASGNTYKNVSTSGTSFGGGYQKFLGDSNFGIRLEGNYVEFDNVKTDNGAGSGSVATGGLNTVEANDLEGLTGKIALTFTLGRN
jgi:hypothetical protein